MLTGAVRYPLHAGGSATPDNDELGTLPFPIPKMRGASARATHELLST